MYIYVCIIYIYIYIYIYIRVCSRLGSIRIHIAEALVCLESRVCISEVPVCVCVCMCVCMCVYISEIHTCVCYTCVFRV